MKRKHKTMCTRCDPPKIVCVSGYYKNVRASKSEYKTLIDKYL